MKRHIRPRTDIPDWRDPDMPVCRHYTFGNGMVKTIVDPDFETKYRAHQMIVMDTQLPSYNDDSTYYGRKEQCRMEAAFNAGLPYPRKPSRNLNPLSELSPRDPNSLTADINEMLRDVRAKLFSR